MVFQNLKGKNKMPSHRATKDLQNSVEEIAEFF